MAGGVHYLDARAPEGVRLYAVGDIHGRHDLLTAMHAHIMQEIVRERPPDWRIVYLGDYTDRGPDSKGVLEFLSRQCAADGRVIALAGNHDIGFLDFLAEPNPAGLFALYGGVETARSYGVDIDFASLETTMRGHAALVEAVPDEHLRFLRDLPFSVAFGDFFFCHAGIRPGVALDAQAPEDLIWIRDEFHRDPRLHPKVVVHGHTPVDRAELMPNRVNIDTGAVFDGLLTTLAVDGGAKRLLEMRK